MPMSPDDYRVLSQYVSPRDLAVVVSSVACCHIPSHAAAQTTVFVYSFFSPMSVLNVWPTDGGLCVCFSLSPHLQANDLICGFEDFDPEVDAASDEWHEVVHDVVRGL